MIPPPKILIKATWIILSAYYPTSTVLEIPASTITSIPILLVLVVSMSVIKILMV